MAATSTTLDQCLACSLQPFLSETPDSNDCQEFKESRCSGQQSKSSGVCIYDAGRVLKCRKETAANACWGMGGAYHSAIRAVLPSCQLGGRPANHVAVLELKVPWLEGL